VVVLMPDSPTREVTILLHAWENGDEEALKRLTVLVYEELHRLAKRFMARETPGHTLQTTGLINETYLRLVDLKNVSWQNRAHFFAICARMMRRILTDFARSSNSMKRGGEVDHITFDEALFITPNLPTYLVSLDDALNRLAEKDPRKCQVVELRFFGGLSVDETAEVLKISNETVHRDWTFAKGWLLREMVREHRLEHC
jgi:RNA polymerase sigma factor (TIGR02999 family)